MGCHRALNAMDMTEAANRRLRAMRSANLALRTAAKQSAKRTLESLRDLRRTIGADGYRLP